MTHDIRHVVWRGVRYATRNYQYRPGLLQSSVKNSMGKNLEEVPVLIVFNYDGGGTAIPSTSLPRNGSRGRRGLMRIAIRPATHSQARKHEKSPL